MIFSDGGCRNTGYKLGEHVKEHDKAAWAYYIQDNSKLEKYVKAGGAYGSTNNQMELTGLIEGMKRAIFLGLNQKKTLFILDSRYVLDPITKGTIWKWKDLGWKRDSGPLKNKELWAEIASLLVEFDNAEFQWVKGHSGNFGNELVDHELNRYMDLAL